MSSADAAQMLRTIADKVERGKVVLTQGAKKTALKIPGQVEVELKAEKETGRRKTTKKLEIEIEWVVGGAGPKEKVKIK